MTNRVANGLGRASAWACLLSCVLVRAAAAEAPDIGELEVRRWGLREGLPQSSITSIVQGPDAYLWVTTFGGIARFDGLTFVVYDVGNTPELGTNRFISGHVDRRGDLWFGGQNGGLVRYHAGRFTDVALPGSGHTAVRAMSDDDDGLWVVTGVGLYVVRDGLASPADVVPPLDGIGDVLAHRDGTLWLSDGAVPVCVRGPCPHVAPSFGVRPFTIGRVMVAAPDGRLWFSDHTRVGSLAADRISHEPMTLPLPPEGMLRGIAHDAARDQLWVSAGRDLWRRERHGRWSKLTAALGDAVAPTRDGIRSLLVDREGALWIGTDRSGLARVRQPDAERFDADRGVAFSSFTVIEDRRGRQWATGACLGPVVRSGGAFETLTDTLGCPGAMALAADGAVWVADVDRLVRFDEDGTTRSLPLVLPHHPTTALALTFDERGALWVGSELDGLIRLEPDGLGFKQVRAWSERELGHPHVQTIVALPEREGGGLWLGTGGGAVRMLGDGHFVRYTAKDGLARGTIRDVLPLGDTVWFGSYGGGLSRLRAGRVATLTTAHGLCDDTVSRLFAVGGELWMNGNRGVAHVAIDELDAVLRGELREVRCQLLQSGEGNGGVQPAGWQGADGRLWFPTIDGVIAVDPRPSEVPPVAPRVVIEAVVGDAGGLDLNGAERHELAPGRGDIAVRYTGLSFDAPHQLRFRHRLVGHEDGWVDAGSGRVVSYRNLPPGDYVFEVQAQSLAGLWSESASVALTLAPAFHETAWFRVLLVLGLGALALALLQLRMRSIRNRNRALQAEVIVRQEAEARAREQELHYRTLFDGTSDGLLVHGPDGRLVEANAAAAALLGADVATLVRDGVAPRLTPEARPAYVGLVQSCIAGLASRPEPVELTVAREHLEVRAQATPFDVRGETHALCTLVDLTAVKRAEAQRREYEQRLQQGQKLEALGLLAGGIAHDFNNHLAAIGTSAQLIAEETAKPEVHELTSDIVSSVERAAALVQKLLVFGRQQPGQIADVDPAVLLSGLTPLLGRLLPGDVRVQRRDEGDGCAAINVDPVLFEQSIINLVVNARDAMPGGGTLTITTRRRMVDAELARLHDARPGDYVVIEVADTGHGMDDATRGKIFDPFFTTKAVGKGTGLGLTVTHAAVSKARGFITVDSELGRGTRLALHFPARPTVAAKPAPRVAPAPTPVVNVTVLLCDDEEIVRRSTKRMLEVRGYRVLDAADAEDALALLRRAPDAIDMLLTDVVLPGMSGAELARQVQLLRPAIPTVFMSGYTRDVLVESFASDGEATFVKKPFTVDALIAAIVSARRDPASTARPPEGSS